MTPPSERWPRIRLCAVSTALGILALAALLGLPAVAEETRLHAQAPVRPPAGPGAQPVVPPPHLQQLGPLGLSHACAPAEVITTKTLVQVQCRTAVQVKGLEEVNVFAVGVEDAAFASRVLRVAMSAQIAGYRVKISFISSDVSGDRLGCPAKTCRLIQTIGLLVN
jgi:hypothetical protein